MAYLSEEQSPFHDNINDVMEMMTNIFMVEKHVATQVIRDLQL